MEKQFSSNLKGLQYFLIKAESQRTVSSHSRITDMLYIGSYRKGEKQQKGFILWSLDFEAKLHWSRTSNEIAGVLNIILGIACNISCHSPVWPTSKGPGYRGRFTVTGQGKNHTYHKGGKKVPGELWTGQANLLLGRSWSQSFWKTVMSTWRTRRLTGNTSLFTKAWPTLLLSLVR